MKNKFSFALSAFLAAMLLPLAAAAALPVPPIPPLPRLVVPAAPSVVLIPGTYAYIAPDIGSDLIFYRGYWYRPHHGYWYRSSGYGGPWGITPAERVPRALIELPHGYRNIRPEHERIPHAQLRSNWKSWEHEKHWDHPRTATPHERRGVVERGAPVRAREERRHSSEARGSEPHESGGGHRERGR